jgi:hypothetical protein
VYPMLDDRTGGRPDPGRGYRRMWSSSSNRLGWRAYFGSASCLEVVSDAFHGFDAVAPKTELAQSFIASQLAFLRRAFDSV